MQVDSYKVAHWMNVRKLTPEQIAAMTQMPVDEVRGVLEPGSTVVRDDVCDRLLEVLAIERSHIASAPRQPRVATMSAEAMRQTRRLISRDGMHFYNYYSMAGAPGRVSPVILDILCPPERLPQLNNGHLEPAITINLGPGDINGRWGDELRDATWSVLKANQDDDRWITGDSYVEPSYCPHSYSLVSERPARIISYTAESNLAELFAQLNDWSEEAFGELLRDVGECQSHEVLASLLARRGFSTEQASRVSGVAPERLHALMNGQRAALGLEDLRTLGDSLGFDYRLLLPASDRHDEVGKTSCAIEQSRATARAFRSYTVASAASAPHLSDLVGLFMEIDKREQSPGELDLVEPGDTHYMVTAGAVSLHWHGDDGEAIETPLRPDATAWVAPYVEHAWSGQGAVVKLGSGRRGGYLDRLELTNTFQAAATLARGRHDALGWGYDTKDE